ncbi:MAG: hypothetical protein JW724_02770 [Candidatus Altiarchaeota archaeon]|nr:hypothetical protein [Candidatus Altiarchaeota archaeon]
MKKSPAKKTLTGILSVLLLAPLTAAFAGGDAFASEVIDLVLRRNFSGVLQNVLESMESLYYLHFTDLVLMNPDPSDPRISGMMDYLIYGLGALYITAFIAIGLYLIFFSGSPRGRSTAKSMIPMIFIGMVFVILSPHIIAPVLSFSSSLSRDIIYLRSENPMDALNTGGDAANPADYFISKFDSFSWSSLEGSLPFMFIALLLIAGALIVMMIRYMAVTFFTMIFPLTIFLYLFFPTRAFGRRLMEQTLLWTTVQITEAVTLLSVASIISMTPLTGVLVVSAIAGSFMLLIVPLATVMFLKNFLP